MAQSRSRNQVTLFVCTARRQTAESVRATPETTVRDVIGRSERAWAMSGAQLDQVAVCVGGVPRRMNDRIGDADTVEVYPPLTRGWLEA
jgi:putative ubiquitin-RnfH superfamily antitoxin RatB of RatAB toxin-antitoxin module